MKSYCLDTNIILEKKEINKDGINKISFYCLIEVLCNENFSLNHVEYIKKNQIKIIKPSNKNIEDIKLDEEEKKALSALFDFFQLEENLKNNKENFLEKIKNIKIKIYSNWTYWIVFYYLKDLILNLSFEFYKSLPNMDNDYNFQKEICNIEKLTNKKWSDICNSLENFKKNKKICEHRNNEYKEIIQSMFKIPFESIFESKIFKKKINIEIDSYFQLFEKYYNFPLIKEKFKNQDIYLEFCKKYKLLFKKYFKLAKEDFLYKFFKHWQKCLEMYPISQDYYHQLLFFAIPFYILERKLEDRKIERNDIFDILILSNIEIKDIVRSKEKNINKFLEDYIPIIEKVWLNLIIEERVWRKYRGFNSNLFYI